MDFLSLLVAAGLSLAEKVVFSWFEEGRSKVKVSQLEKTIAELCAREAARARLHEDELRRMTERLVKELITESPKLAYVKPRFHEPVVSLDFNPKDPASSKALLQDLHLRLSSIADREKGAQRARDDAEMMAPGQAPAYEIMPPAQKPPTGSAGAPSPRSAELLNDLQQRISDREDPRQ